MRAIALFIFTIAFAWSGWSVVVGAEEIDPVSAKLIEQLRSDDFDQRHQAAHALEQRGEAARPALIRALADADADVRSMATGILAKLTHGVLQLHLSDREGKALSNLEGTLVLQSQRQFAGQNAPPREMPFKADGGGNATIKLDVPGSLSYLIKSPGIEDGGDAAWTWLNVRPGINRVNVVLRRGATLNGSLQDGEGKPIKDGSITLYSGMAFDPDLLEIQILMNSQGANVPFVMVPASNGEGRVAQTNAAGKWEFTSLPNGVYTCIAQAPGHYPAISGMVRVRENGTTTVPPTTMKTRNAGKIEMTFKQADGSPLAKKSVVHFAVPVLSKEQRAKLPAYFQDAPLHSNTSDTDEKGVILIDDLSPGKYVLTASTEAEGEKSPGGVLLKTEIEVKAGETVRPAVGTLSAKSEKFGSIKGRIVNAAEKGAKNVGVQLKSEQEFIAEQTGANREMNSRDTSEVRTDAKGIYRIHNVSPGKYVLVFGSRDGFQGDPDGYVFGVVVENDKQTLAPVVVLNNAASRVQPTTIKGRVFLPDGTPAQNAEVTCFSKRQCMACNTQPDGTFEQTIPGLNLPAGETAKEFIIVKHADCKPQLVEGPFTTKREIRLEKLQFGSLRVTVVDEKGKPLPGVTVSGSCESKRDPFSGSPMVNAAVTNAKGAVRLTGLASGPRELYATLRGYYMPKHHGDVIVVANEERDFKLVLQTGIQIKARVALPADFPTEHVLAKIDNESFHGVQANGEVVFDGVGPGTHVITAEAPGLVERKSFRFSLPEDPEKIAAAIPNERVVELTRQHGLAIDCGKEYAGCAVQLDAIETLNVAMDQRDTYPYNFATVDATGRVEFDLLPPGKFQVTVMEPDFSAQANDSSRLVVHPSSGPFESKPISTQSDLAAMTAEKAHLTRGTGQIKAHLQISGIAHRFDLNTAANIGLQVQGPSGSANGSVNDSVLSFIHPADPLITVGSPPEGCRLHVPGSFEVINLPAGEYTIWATNYNQMYNENEEDDEPQNGWESKIIATFTIKEGEQRDLGELKFDLKGGDKNRNPDDYLKPYMRTEDKAPEFQP